MTACPQCGSTDPAWGHLVESLACRVDTYGVESLTEREQMAYNGETVTEDVEAGRHPGEPIDGLGPCELCWRRQAEYERRIEGETYELCRKCWYKEAALERMGVR